MNASLPFVKSFGGNRGKNGWISADCVWKFQKKSLVKLLFEKNRIHLMNSRNRIIMPAIVSSNWNVKYTKIPTPFTGIRIDWLQINGDYGVVLFAFCNQIYALFLMIVCLCVHTSRIWSKFSVNQYLAFAQLLLLQWHNSDFRIVASINLNLIHSNATDKRGAVHRLR